MKIFAKLVMVALLAAGAMSAPAYAQAISLKDASGAPLPIGTPVTATGPMDMAVASIVRRTCVVSMDGTVTAANVITFAAHTPGFVSSCAGDFNPNFEMKFLSSLQVQVSNLIAGPCTMPVMNFSWGNSVSTATLSSIATNGLCYLHAGSYFNISPSVKV
jgi:hypothetical protein